MSSADVLPTIVGPPRAHLYELAADFQRLLDGLLAAETDEERGALLADIPEVHGAAVEKFDGCCAVLAELSHRAKGRKEQADRMAALAKADEARAEWLRGYMLRALQTMEVDRIETPRFRVSVVQNPPAVQVLEPAMVPAKFKTIVETVQIDKVAIRKAITQDGEVVPGVELTRGTSLRVS